jgi:hypothetical protein
MTRLCGCNNDFGWIHWHNEMVNGKSTNFSCRDYALVDVQVKAVTVQWVDRPIIC